MILATLQHFGKIDLECLRFVGQKAEGSDQQENVPTNPTNAKPRLRGTAKTRGSMQKQQLLENWRRELKGLQEKLKDAPRDSEQRQALKKRVKELTASLTAKKMITSLEKDHSDEEEKRSIQIVVTPGKKAGRLVFTVHYTVGSEEKRKGNSMGQSFSTQNITLKQVAITLDDFVDSYKVRNEVAKLARGQCLVWLGKAEKEFGKTGQLVAEFEFPRTLAEKPKKKMDIQEEKKVAQKGGSIGPSSHPKENDAKSKHHSDIKRSLEVTCNAKKMDGAKYIHGLGYVVRVTRIEENTQEAKKNLGHYAVAELNSEEVEETFDDLVAVYDGYPVAEARERYEQWMKDAKDAAAAGQPIDEFKFTC